MPNYFYLKDYYIPAFTKCQISPPFFVVPPKRICYKAPKGSGDTHGAKRTKTQRVTSPFHSFWYVHDGKKRPTELIQWCTKSLTNCTVAATSADLPLSTLDSADPRRAGLTPQQRKALRKKTSDSGEPLCKKCGQISGNCKHTR